MEAGGLLGSSETSYIGVSGAKTGMSVTSNTVTLRADKVEGEDTHTHAHREVAVFNDISISALILPVLLSAKCFSDTSDQCTPIQVPLPSHSSL